MTLPILKWAGGKRHLLEALRPRLPGDYEQRRHVELFAGGAALFFALEPKRAVLADACEPLMATYTAVRNAPERVLRSLSGYAQHHSEQGYYAVRERFNSGKLRSPSLAAAMLYLNRAGYNGLFRCNRRGSFNVPWGGRDRRTIYVPESVWSAVPPLRRADLWVGDFEACGAVVEAGDFVYLDPPYAPSCCAKSASFQAYLAEGFSHRDHLRLRDYAESLSALGAQIMVSNSDVPFVRDIWRDWRIDTVKARRSIGADGAGRGRVRELVIRNYGAKK